MITIFSTYVTPKIKDINHPSLLQEWKLNLDAAEYVKNIKANMYEPSGKINLIVWIVINTGKKQ